MFVKFFIRYETIDGPRFLPRSHLNARWEGEYMQSILTRAQHKIEDTGEWRETANKPGHWEYCATEQEIVWANKMDRLYLRTLLANNPDTFLKEMTPNPEHNGTCVGLDLSHPHHMNLQKEFQSEVKRLCQEKGFMKHPALLYPLQNLHVMHSESKPSKKNHCEQQKEITRLKAMIVELQNTITQQKQTNQQRMQHLIHEKEAWLEERRTFLEQVALLQKKLTAARNPRPSWLRVWEGKYTLAGETPQYQPVAAKQTGCTIGFMVKTPKGKQYLAKLGFPNEEYEVAPSLSTRKHNYQRSIFSVITEKIGADVYGVLGHGFYYVPKHRLARLKILNPFTKNNPQAIALMQKMNQHCKKRNQITEGVHLLSRWIEQYRDIDTLSKCLHEKTATQPHRFLDCLSAGYVPNYAIIEGQVVPILGLMELMAASRLLADTDVLGGGGKNAGYVVERSDAGVPLAVRVVKVDAGEAFNFSGENNQLTQSFNPISTATKLKDAKDLQFGNQQPITIPWSGLLASQKSAFLLALRRGLALLSQEAVTDFFICRQGEFDRAVTGKRIVLIDKLVHPFKKAWRRYQEVQTMVQVYGDVMSSATEPAPSAVPFRAKMYGAVNHQAKDAIALSMRGSVQ